MRYKIKDIPSEGLPVELDLPRTLLSDALEGVEANLDATTANARLELTRDRDDNVFVRGDVKALVTVPCAKCLAPALVKIDAPLDMTFVAEGEEVAEPDDPLAAADVAEHDGVTVDLEPILREQIILSLPISAYCRDNCAGLCATCGHNKNESDCGHRPPTLEDARLAALKNLKLS